MGLSPFREGNIGLSFTHFFSFYFIVPFRRALTDIGVFLVGWFEK